MEHSPLSSARTARVGDVERDACIERLTTELVHGRITEAEFGERSQIALEARTRADLAALGDDLDFDSSIGSVVATDQSDAPASKPARAALTLSAADLMKGGGYIVVSAFVCFIALGWLIPDVFSQLLLWLFSLVSAGVGAALARSRPGV